MPRITLKHTLVAALAAGALGASTATAKPVDRHESPTSSLAGTVAKQDLRGEQALEAARIAAQPQDLRGEHALDAAAGRLEPAKPPVYWSYTYQATKPVSAPAARPADGDNDLWLIVGIALSATGIVAGTAVAVARRSRVRVPA